MTVAGRKAFAKAIAKRFSGPVGMAATMAEMSGLAQPFDRKSYEKVIDLRGIKRKSVQGATTQGRLKAKNTLAEPVVQTATSVLPTMAYGSRRRPLRPRSYGVLRSRGRRRSRRPPRKRTFAKRVKKVLGDVSEAKYVIAPTPAIGTTSEIAAAAGELFYPTLITGTAPAEVGKNGRYEFSKNYPAMGYMRLGRGDQLPKMASQLTNQAGGYNLNSTDTFVGRRVDLTGFTVSGVVEALAQGLSQAFVRIHILTANTSRMPVSTNAAIAALGAGAGTCIGSNMFSNRAGYVDVQAAETQGKLHNEISAGLELFDVNLGDRHSDIAYRRIGWFNHGYKLMPGMSIVTSVTVDQRLTPNASQLSNTVHPFKFFVPYKRTFKDLQTPSTGEGYTNRTEEMLQKLKLTWILVEICQLDCNDNVLFGATTETTSVRVCMNAPRLHFKDHS